MRTTQKTSPSNQGTHAVLGGSMTRNTEDVLRDVLGEFTFSFKDGYQQAILYK